MLATPRFLVSCNSILSLLCRHHGVLTSLVCCSWFQLSFSLFSSFCVLSITISRAKYSVSILRHFIIRGIVDRTSHIWSDRNLSLLFFVAWLTVPAIYGVTVTFLHGMVDRTSHIWSDHNLSHSFFVAWLTIPAIYGVTVILAVHSSWHG